jgi:DNA polymerase-4
MARRIMHIDLDAFFVSVEQVANPSLQGKPVVVGGKPDRRGVVAAASYEARAFGLHAGMPLTTASRLCPQAIFIEGSFPKYREASERFMGILASFSPFLEPGGLDEAYLEVTGFESLHGSIREMALKIKRRVKEGLGLNASIGIAANKLVAKVASERSKPDGLIEVTDGEEGTFLAPLAIRELPGIGEKTEQTLRDLGIRTIGELASLSASVLKSRFGVYGEVLHRHASGIDERGIEPSGEAKSISRETTFAEDTRDRAYLEATLRYLSERVGSQLREQEREARSVTLKLRYADFTTITRRHTLNRSTSTDQNIFKTGRELLKRALPQERQPVRLIGIGVGGLTEPARQLSLWEPVLKMEKLDRTIDRIRKRYGFTAIQTGRTMKLKDIFPSDEEGYSLHTPSLSR